MDVIFDVPGVDASDRCFFAWAPASISLRLQNADAGETSHPVTLRNAGAPGGGRLNFHTEKSDQGSDELTIDLPSDGSPVEVWVAGEFGEPSTEYGDAAIAAFDETGSRIGLRDCMVRVRKNAVTLTSAERDRFLVALANLNDAGTGPFRGFRDMHVAASGPEAHGFAGFLPWHRAYILDLERSLQEIDPTVAMPYWRFDEPAPDLFAPEFLGMPNPDASLGDEIEFPPGHPLEFWRTDVSDPIERRPLWSVDDAPPQFIMDSFGQPVRWVISQAATLALGGPLNLYASFRGMEGAPHGTAHVSFQGPISSVPTAAKDPLFFLLHTNVDRLWALWQWFHARTDPDLSETYSLSGNTRQPNNIGHKLDDTMWPWNQETTPPRPSFTPPRPPFAASLASSRPGAQPTIREMIDYQGVHQTEALGFSYDDVPFELEDQGVIS